MCWVLALNISLFSCLSYLNCNYIYDSETKKNNEAENKKKTNGKLYSLVGVWETILFGAFNFLFWFKLCIFLVEIWPIYLFPLNMCSAQFNLCTLCVWGCLHMYVSALHVWIWYGILCGIEFLKRCSLFTWPGFFLCVPMILAYSSGIRNNICAVSSQFPSWLLQRGIKSTQILTIFVLHNHKRISLCKSYRTHNDIWPHSLLNACNKFGKDKIIYRNV